MKNLELTIVERQILANQFRIRAILEEDDSHNHKAFVLEEGLQYEYGQVFNAISDELPYEVSNETHSILTMFRQIKNTLSQLDDAQMASLELDKLEFKGFDGNNDDHYSYARFLIHEKNLYRELKGIELDSHDSLTILSYRKMLNYLNSKEGSEKYTIDYDDLIKMQQL